MLAHKYIVFLKPMKQYYNHLSVQYNTIGDIIGIFKSKETAKDFCKAKKNVVIKEVEWEE